MNRRAKYQLIGLITGLIMLAAGVFIFASGTSIESGFLGRGASWAPWKVILVLLPLTAGTVMMMVKPEFKISRIIAISGALLVVIVFMADLTIIIKKDFNPAGLAAGSILLIGGAAVCLTSLFIKKKK